MNVKAFKNLIKEAVAEAVREELHTILNENQTSTKRMNESKTFNFTSNDVQEVGDVRNQLRSKLGAAFGLEQPTVSNAGVPLVVDKTNDNPYMNFIMDAAANMTAQDKAGLNNLG
jgi:hypothetical protein